MPTIIGEKFLVLLIVGMMATNTGGMMIMQLDNGMEVQEHGNTIKIIIDDIDDTEISSINYYINKKNINERKGAIVYENGQMVMEQENITNEEQEIFKQIDSTIEEALEDIILEQKIKDITKSRREKLAKKLLPEKYSNAVEEFFKKEGDGTISAWKLFRIFGLW